MLPLIPRMRLGRGCAYDELVLRYMRDYGPEDHYIHWVSARLCYR